jgi:hypothetical protein
VKLHLAMQGDFGVPQDVFHAAVVTSRFHAPNI